ncbi:MAG: acyltransferase [Ruminococcaceae bacterium]|nr:acyltransferase [Oscillospiraceae bacterium]
MHEQLCNDKQSADKSAFYYISKYRSALMGLALIWVVWYHSSVYLDFFPLEFINKTFEFIKSIGYGGVDIFFFVSGFGIYISLENHSTSQYIKNRIKRITPTWWTYLIICILLGQFVFRIYFTKTEIFGFLTYTGFWLGLSNQGNWYIYTIMLFYLVSPVIHALIKNSKHKLLTAVVLLGVSLAISFAFMDNPRLIAISRLPLYIIGMSVPPVLKNVQLRKIHWLVIFVSFVAGISALYLLCTYAYDYLWDYGLWWYPYIIVAPTFSLLLTKVFDKLHRFIKPLTALLSLLGRASLEILLASDYMLLISYKLNIRIHSFRTTAILVVVASFVFGLVFYFSINKATKLSNKLIRKLKSKQPNT